jgi:hypothetical protein
MLPVRRAVEFSQLPNAMWLPPSLKRCLCTTNIIENPNGIVRRTSHP